MQVTITPAGKPPAPAIKYPCLMETVSGPHCVVLFTSVQEGTRLHFRDSEHLCGFHSASWIRADDASTWRPFKGTITLEQA